MSEATINLFEKISAQLIALDKITLQPRNDVVLSNIQWNLQETGIANMVLDPTDASKVTFLPIGAGNLGITAIADINFK